MLRRPLATSPCLRFRCFLCRAFKWGGSIPLFRPDTTQSIGDRSNTMSRPSANGETVVEVLTTVNRRRWTLSRMDLGQQLLLHGQGNGGVRVHAWTALAIHAVAQLSAPVVNGPTHRSKSDPPCSNHGARRSRHADRGRGHGDTGFEASGDEHPLVINRRVSG